MGYARSADIDAAMAAGRKVVLVKELEVGLYHEFDTAPPCEWSASKGATHTLFTMDGPRPAILKKTVAYIGIGETDDGDINWDKWPIRWHRCSL